MEEFNQMSTTDSTSRTDTPAAPADPAGDTESSDGADSSPTTVFQAAATAGDIEAVFEPVARLVDECRVQLSEDSIEIAAIDAANVAMVQVAAENALFHSFRASESTLGVPLDRFLEILGMAGSDDSLVQMQLNPETRKLDIVVDDIEYSMALLDPDTIKAEPDIPDVTLPATFEVASSALKQGFKACDMVSENCLIEADAESESVTISADGDTDSVNYWIKSRDDDLVSFEMDDPREHTPESEVDVLDEDSRPDDLTAAAVRSIFSLDYLKDMRVVYPSDSPVGISLGTEFPVRTEFSLGGGEVDVEYLLAPRIGT